MRTRAVKRLVNLPSTHFSYFGYPISGIRIRWYDIKTFIEIFISKIEFSTAMFFVPIKNGCFFYCQTTINFEFIILAMTLQNFINLSYTCPIKMLWKKIILLKMGFFTAKLQLILNLFY